MNDQLDLDKINQKISDRHNVFYWQTDRIIEPEEVAKIWADRHSSFSDEELLTRVNEVLDTEKLVSIVPMDPSAQTNLGSINSVRVGVLESGKELIIRCHPKGVKNGYFHAEALAAQQAKNAGLPSFSTLAIHEFEGADDFAFIVLEKLPGTAIKKWLDEHPEDENKLVMRAGKMMARVHKIDVEGFGPFDNERAKNGELVGLHKTYGGAMRTGLEFNLEVLENEAVITAEQSSKIKTLFEDTNPAYADVRPVLIHNDFADWNLLTDGEDISGILDWDECVGGDAIMDIACWSTFFPPERTKPFLEGYFEIVEKPADFEERFELYRLRYVLSKMTLRIRRYSWDKNPEVKTKIENGKLHLAESMSYFGI